MYELYRRQHNSPARLCEVWVDHERGLCKKIFCTNTTLSDGRHVILSDDAVERAYRAEIHWSSIPTPYTLQNIENGSLNDRPGYYVIQPWCGPDLLNYHINGTLHNLIPDLEDQILDMFRWHQRIQLYKLNDALSNMGLVNGRIIAFDFKWACHRSGKPILKEIAIDRVHRWIAKFVSPATLDKILETL